MADAIINNILEQMQPITLSEMQGVHLMDRVDSKYVAPITILPELLKATIPSFKVQITNGKRIASYATQYLDTPALDFFIMHQDGKQNRQKIRIRSYIDSNISFLEIKNKNDKGRTRKIRVPVECSHIQTISDLNANLSFLEKHAILDSHNLEPVLGTIFDRITLVNHRATERVTLDLNLSFINYRTGNEQKADQLLIVELKQDGWQPSDFRDILDRLNIKQVSFSKYCIGTALTDPAVKYDRLKDDTMIV
ncbi:MAG: polyphosphate polymerase domain-containing protein [Dysgonamonadaceae bacterium]|jgi:hypothetical protein|nr:polyphosphate polymerase domain-containing protein [Dysgonamonadaceae bacterium]